MSEQEAVDNAPLPRTRQSLADDLRALGVVAGMTLIMHSSLKSLGWVSGGPVAVIQALMDVVTASGTIVVPTKTSDYIPFRLLTEGRRGSVVAACLSIRLL